MWSRGDARRHRQRAFGAGGVHDLLELTWGQGAVSWIRTRNLRRNGLGPNSMPSAIPSSTCREKRPASSREKTRPPAPPVTRPAPPPLDRPPPRRRRRVERPPMPMPMPMERKRKVERPPVERPGRGERRPLPPQPRRRRVPSPVAEEEAGSGKKVHYVGGGVYAKIKMGVRGRREDAREGERCCTETEPENPNKMQKTWRRVGGEQSRHSEKCTEHQEGAFGVSADFETSSQPTRWPTLLLTCKVLRPRKLN
mmetsp:Transcript_18979/g.47450  ORF Transcript_18979/g.47450 Transcript_18979/m.47450 type:complete len:253 (-) Transcript_18979:670-1428(-)